MHYVTSLQPSVSQGLCGTCTWVRIHSKCSVQYSFSSSPLTCHFKSHPCKAAQYIYTDAVHQDIKTHLAISRVDSHLHVGTSALYAHLADDRHRCIAQPLILLVRQSLHPGKGSLSPPPTEAQHRSLEVYMTAVSWCSLSQRSGQSQVNLMRTWMQMQCDRGSALGI